jgi:UDP-N-acetylmuramoyl-L-alanyl-D-glutamate--2,6-diaminopimelate ligase
MADAFALRLGRRFGASWLVEGKCRRLTPTSTHLEARTPRGRLAVRLPLPGWENARAGLAAASIALALGVPLPAVSAGLGRASSVPGCLEPVRTGQGFAVLVDAASGAAELEAVLRTVRGFTAGRGRVLLLFGCGSRHPAAERAALGEVAARGADDAILTSDNPGWEPPEVIAAQVASGYVRGRGVPPRMVPDRAEAIQALLREARRGDCVLLTGKGHRTVQELGGCVLPFDDRDQARAALAAFDPAPEAAEAVMS